MDSKEISSIHTMRSKFTPKILYDIMKKISHWSWIQPVVSWTWDEIIDTPKDFVDVYRVFFLN